MKILITGASGFIGSNLVSSLYGVKEYELHLIHRGLEGIGSEIAGVFEYNVDLTHENWPARLPDIEMDVVIHLAQSNHYREFPAGAQDMFDVNVKSTFDLLEWSRKHNVKRFMFASTGSLNNRADDNPSMYKSTKLIAEKLVNQYFEFFSTMNMRLYTVYGVGQTDKLIPNLIRKIKSGEPIKLDENVTVHPVHVSDCVKSIINLMASKARRYPLTTNICSDEQFYSLHDFVELLRKVVEGDYVKGLYTEDKLREVVDSMQ